MMLKVKAFEMIGNAQRFLLGPALRPLFRELYDQQRRIVAAMMDNNHYFTDEQGYVREKKFEDGQE